MLSGYSYPAHVVLHNQVEDTRHIVSPLQGLQAIYGADNVRYAKGCSIIEVRQKGAPVFPGDVRAGGIRPSSPVSLRTDGIPEAVDVARHADVAIVLVGDLAGLFQTGTIGEGSDADSLDLPGVQQQLLQAVVDTGTPTVVVLTSGRPYNLGGLEDRVAAFVMAFAGGQQGGTAIAEVLSGRSEATGRLTVSVPANVGAMPYYYNHKFKSGGTPIALHFGSRYPFGHGLSYTRFEYRNLEVPLSHVPIEDGEIVIGFDVANTGSRKGVEIPQLYVRDLLASVVRPVRELKAFGRVELGAGEVARLTFRVPVDMLAFTGMAGARIIEPGKFELGIGASSADIRLRAQVDVCGSTRTLERNWRMESSCEIHPLSPAPLL
jgi:beta-glucosidase